MCYQYITSSSSTCLFVFFFNDTATTEIYTLSLHDALPIYALHTRTHTVHGHAVGPLLLCVGLDRKSTRLNSSHGYISYAVFCLKKKKMKLRSSPPELSPAPLQLSNVFRRLALFSLRCIVER